MNYLETMDEMTSFKFVDIGNLEVYTKPCQASKIECFAKIVNA